MHRRSLSNDYQNFSHLQSSRKPPHQDYDPIQHTEEVLYSNPVYTPSNMQRRSQPLPLITDLADSLSAFDEQKPRLRRRSNLSSLPAGYVPPNPNQRSSVSDVRLVTANAMRERLLTDIHDNIIEIERELSTLEVRPSMSNYFPPRFPAVTDARPKCIHQQARALREETSHHRNRPKKVYEVVVPPSAAESKRSSKSIEPITLPPFVGQYHYGIEIGESEIATNDPENTEFDSTFEELPKEKYDTSTTEQFIRQQSPLPLDRALFFVPIYGIREDLKTTEDLQDKTPPAINVDRSSIASPLHDIESSDKLNIQDFNLLIQTAPEPKIPTPPPIPINPSESDDILDDELINTMFSRPLKHNRLSTRSQETLSSTQPPNKNVEHTGSGGFGYFFSDFSNEGDGEGEEDLISLDLSNFAVPITSEINPDDNVNNTVIQQSRILILNPTNNEHVKDKKKDDHTTKRIVTTPSTSPSKQIVPTPTDDNTKIPSAKANNNTRQLHQPTAKKTSTTSTVEPPKDSKLSKSSFHFNSSLIALEHKDMNKTSLKTTNVNDKRPISGNKQSQLVRQRSSSLQQGHKPQTTNTAPRHQSVVPTDIVKRTIKPPNQQKSSAESRRTSGLPVPLHAIDLNNERVSTSRSVTPERRSSIPTIDQNTLSAFTDIINFDDDEIEAALPSTLFDTNVLHTEEEEEASKRSSALQLTSLVTDQRRTTSNKKECPDEQLSQSHIVDFSSTNNHEKPEECSHILFSYYVTHIQMNGLNNWLESLNTITTKKHLSICQNELNGQESKTTDEISHQTIRRSSEPYIRSTRYIQVNIDQLTDNERLSSTYEKHLPTKYLFQEWNDSVANAIFLTHCSKLNNDVEDNFNDKFEKESPPNRPKWNGVSKTRSTNSIYNPKLSRSNSLRKGWDPEVRRKRAHKLPPLEQKRDHQTNRQLAIEGPPANDRLAIEYSYDPSLIGRSDGTASSRRSSRALVPIRHFSDVQASSDISRSQRPIHREWYDESNRSHLSHRMDIDRITNNSYHHGNSSRELVPLRSLTRNSQNSLTNGIILDSSVRTNRATELRLSRDLDEHHQHSHDTNQSMPFEIRGFNLKGKQLSNSDDAKIRPLSNVNYQTSERVKHRRTYPWGALGQPGTSSSQNTTLIPISEFRHASFITSLEQVPPFIDEE